MMRILDHNGVEISETDVDLSVGYLMESHIIKADAAPIDRVNKFVWADDDYETVLIYRLYPHVSDEPTDKERIDQLEEALELLLSGVTE